MAPDHTHGDTTIKGNSGQTALPTQFGRYEVKKKLGNGAMGTVYLVVNTVLEREEALKVPHFVDGDDTQVRERFLREAKSAAKLEHANICPVYASGVQDGIYYMTMRYLPGNELSAYKGVAQPARKAVEIVIKLARALEAAHAKGVIHRDLKPSNVMMVNGVEPVVMDFGLAKLVVHADQSRSHAGEIGTPSYMPPEQVNGDRELMGPASDVYSLGVILYELLTGRLPFEGTVGAVYAKILHTEPPLPSALVAGLSPVLDGICRKAMAKAPTDRYTSMKAFAAALLHCFRAMPASAGAGKLVLSGADKAAIFEAPTVAPGPLNAEMADVIQRPAGRPAPPLRRKAPPRFVKPARVITDSTWPEPKPAWKRWLKRVFVTLAIFVAGVIGLIAYSLLQRMADERRFLLLSSRATFDKLTVGMTLKELENVLGEGKLAHENKRDEDKLFFSTEAEVFGLSTRSAWEKAIKEGRVQIWSYPYGSSEEPAVAAAFSGTPSSDSKMEALLMQTFDVQNGLSGLRQKPTGKWAVNKDNFVQLEVGMSLKQLEDVIGIGKPVDSPADGYGGDLNGGWRKAAKEYRVYQWLGQDDRGHAGPFIQAAFSAPPSAAISAKVEALMYRDGKWDQDKGALSEAKN